MQQLSILDGDADSPQTAPQEMEPIRHEPFRYAFLALLALNVFLISGGASFALLYFSH